MATTATTVTSIFTGLKTPKDLSKYTLMRGVTDFANLSSYNLFETGYSFLVVVSIPVFLTKLKDLSTEYKTLIETFQHIIEYEFRGLEGLDGMTAETSELTNGISSLDIITKVTLQSNSKFSLKYFEKSGSTITKVQELYLRGLKDPRTQVKTYNGLIKAGLMEAGYENEVFSFLYFVTDNTLTNIEKAYYLVSCQLTGADFSIYNSEKGDIGFKEIGVEFNGFPVTGPAVNAKAKSILDTINLNTTFIETDFIYTGVAEIAPLVAIKPTNNTGIISQA